MRCALLLLFLCLIVAVINAKPTTEAAEIDGDVGRQSRQKTTSVERGRNREQKDVEKVEYDDVSRLCTFGNILFFTKIRV